MHIHVHEIQIIKTSRYYVAFDLELKVMTE